MKKTRFTEEQVVKILREADKAPVAEVAEKHGMRSMMATGANFRRPIRRFEMKVLMNGNNRTRGFWSPKVR